MHIVYLNNQQYIAQSVHATTIVSLLCVYILLRHTLKSLRNKRIWRFWSVLIRPFIAV